MSSRSTDTTNVFVVPDTRRVRRYRVDGVGNNLDAVLRWCDIHHEPVFVFDDGSFSCPYDLVTEVESDDHNIVDGPWEMRGTDE